MKTVKIPITADTTQYNKEISKAGKKTEKELIPKGLSRSYQEAGKRAGQQFAQGLRKATKGISAKLSDSFKGAFSGAMIGSLAMGVGRKIIGQFGEFQDLAKQQEEAENNLKAALKNTGDASTETFAKLKKGATEIQKLTTVGDESAMALMQLGLSMGVSNDKILETTKGAIGLSKSLKIDMGSAMQMLALANQGDYNMLKRKIPALRGVKDATVQAAIVQKKLADGFKIAEAETQTASGRMDQMKNSVNDTKETFGQIITELKANFAPIIKTIADRVGKFATENKELIKTAVEIIAIIAGVVGVIKLWTMAQGLLNVVMSANPISQIILVLAALVAGIIIAYNKVDWFRDAVNWLWEEIKILSGYIWEAIKFWAKWMNPIGQSIQLFKLLYKKLGFFKKAVDSVVGAVKSAVGWFTDLVGITGKSEKKTKKVTETTKKHTETVKESTKVIKKDTEATKGNTRAKSAQKITIDSLTKSLAQMYMKGLENTKNFSSGMAKLMQMKEAKKKFGEAIDVIKARTTELDVTELLSSTIGAGEADLSLIDIPDVKADIDKENEANHQKWLNKKAYYENIEKLNQQHQEQIDAQERAEAERQKELQTGVQDIMKSGLMDVGKAFGQFVADSEISFKAFSKMTMSIMIDSAEKMIQLYTPEILAKSISMLGPVAGTVAGLLAIGTVTGLLEVAKAKISGAEQGTDFTNDLLQHSGDIGTKDTKLIAITPKESRWGILSDTALDVNGKIVSNREVATAMNSGISAENYILGKYNNDNMANELKLANDKLAKIEKANMRVAKRFENYQRVDVRVNGEKTKSIDYWRG